MKSEFGALREFFQQDEVKDIEARLRSVEHQEQAREGTRGFAVEDGDGNVIKIFVDESQAEDFERALSSRMNDEKGEPREIADVLFELKPHFDIKDVEWPKEAIPEDEETVPEEGEPVDEFGEDGESEQPDVNDLDTALDSDLEGGAPTDQAAQAFDVLGKVVDMLKADADAKTAEAKARQAEAEANIAKKATETSKLRAEQEEEILDMEEYNKRKKEQKEDEELRQKLIKYRHEKNKNNGDDTMNENYNDPIEITPEEEEILDMEDWEKKEKEKKDQENIRKRVAKFRHNRKKQEAEERSSREERYKQVLDRSGRERISEVTFQQYIKAVAEDSE